MSESWCFEGSRRVWSEGHRLQLPRYRLHLAGPRRQRGAQTIADSSGSISPGRSFASNFLSREMSCEPDIGYRVSRKMVVEEQRG